MTTIEEFIGKAVAVHGSSYDYSKVTYRGAHTPVCIICPIHGEFLQPPTRHLSGSGCMPCAVQRRSEAKRLTQEDFVKRASAVHGEKYDYGRVVYVGTSEKVCIVCPQHGEFFQTSGNHMAGQGCPQCGIIRYADKRRQTTEGFIDKAKEIHGPQYDYSQVVYSHSTAEVCIICPTHGEFLQKPSVHLTGSGCAACGLKSVYDQSRHTTDIFIQNAIAVHGDIYDYSRVTYKNALTKVSIVCPAHGEFFQSPSKHLSGHRCPHCGGSKGERAITRWLNKRGIPFHYHHLCRIGTGKRSLHFDFLTKGIKVLIEFDGEQHFRPTRFNGMSEEKSFEVFKKTQHHDSLKNQYCVSSNLPLLRISYKEFNSIPEILFTKLQSGAPSQKRFVNEMTPEELASYYEEGSK